MKHNLSFDPETISATTAEKYQFEIRNKMRAMLDKADKSRRDLTAAESGEYDGLDAELQAVEKVLASASPRIVDPSAPGGFQAQRTNHMPATTAPRMLAAFGESPRDARESAYRAGQWIRAQLLKESTSIRWCNENGLSIQNAMSEGINTAGGFLVPEEFSIAILRLTEEFGVARKECRTVGMSSDTLIIPRRTGGLTSYFVGENVAGEESDTTWGNVTLTAKKLMILTRMSSELSEDAVIDLAALLADEIALSFAAKEDNCLFNGDGTSTYGGMVGVLPKIIADSRVGAVDVATATHDLFSEVDATDLSGLMAKCPTYALRNAKWYTSRTGYAQVFERLIQAAGGATFADLVLGPQQKGYMGYPIVISDYMPNVTTSLDGVAMLLFGDMRQAVTMGVRREVRVALSGERYFELDQVGVRGTERFDIVAHDLGDNTTPGPIVGLIGSTS